MSDIRKQLDEQLTRDKAAWNALSPTVQKAMLNELAAIWPCYPGSRK